jgi:hypothetical protein
MFVNFDNTASFSLSLPPVPSILLQQSMAAVSFGINIPIGALHWTEDQMEHCKEYAFTGYCLKHLRSILWNRSLSHRRLNIHLAPIRYWGFGLSERVPGGSYCIYIKALAPL